VPLLHSYAAPISLQVLLAWELQLCFCIPY